MELGILTLSHLFLLSILILAFKEFESIISRHKEQAKNPEHPQGGYYLTWHVPFFYFFFRKPQRVSVLVVTPNRSAMTVFLMP